MLIIIKLHSLTPHPDPSIEPSSASQRAHTAPTPPVLSLLDWLLKNRFIGASLVAQWLRIRLPMQETWVRALVLEDPTCCGATKPVRHNY